MSPIITIIVAIVIMAEFIQDTGITHIHTTTVTLMATHTTHIHTHTIMAIHTVHTCPTTVFHITINHKKHNNNSKMEPSVLFLKLATETLSVMGVVRGALSV